MQNETSGKHSKPRLSLGQIINMSVGFLGIQFGFALQNGNASRILQGFGADVEELPNFWLVAPIIGLIVQPIIGHYSDRTWTKLGRRRPYFLAGAICACTLPDAKCWLVYQFDSATLDWRRHADDYGRFVQC